MAGKSLLPSHDSPFQPPVTLMKLWKEKTGDGKGEDIQTTTLQTATKMLNKELEYTSCEQSYHISCEPALMGLTAGCLLSPWTA